MSMVVMKFHMPIYITEFNFRAVEVSNIVETHQQCRRTFIFFAGLMYLLVNQCSNSRGKNSLSQLGCEVQCL